ncbi:MAG: O-antigen ligase family protein [Erysipelotrichaceae bacterium]|nr:O-antigen ligase family protein [Erysipelotrichaceae bacterium]
MFKKYLTKENFFALLFVLVALHPFYEMDYLFSSFLNSFGGFRPSVFIDYILFPLMVLIAFLCFEKNKKKVLTFVGIYAVLLIAYFIPHCKTGLYLQDNIHLGYTFMFTYKDEIIYLMCLLLPLAYIYVYNFTEITESIIKKISVVISAFVSLPIVISNFLQVGYTTYLDVMAGSFFDWFSLPFNDTDKHPRRYATKFFFEEGNTIGVLMVIVLPFMYYFFLKETDKRKKALLGFLILSDSLSMMMLGTRIASYCAILIPITVLAVHVFTAVIKTEKFKVWFAGFCVLLTLINAGILPYCPAYQNQKFDASDFSTLKLNDDIREGFRKGIEEGAEGMEPFGPAWIDYYCYMFLQYKFLVGVTPAVYYEYWYDYRVDPKFWVDLIFDYELEERVNARQLETIFYKYKWDLLTPAQKLTGFTWSLFMWGGITIEKDFLVHFYTYGYLGFPLIMGPWVVMFLYMIYKFLRSYKYGKWNMFNFTLMMSVALSVVASYASGHGYDELTVTMFVALCCTAIIQRMRNNEQA